MFLIFLVFVLGKKNNHFNSLKYQDYPIEESAVTAAEEIIRIKSLMTDETGADFKVANNRKLLHLISYKTRSFIGEVLTESREQG